MKISRHCFSFSFFNILIGLLRKLARDRWKFLVTFVFVFVFLHWSLEETGKRRSKISRHFFLVFYFSFFLYFIFITRRIVPKSDKKYKASSVWLSKMTYIVEKFLVTNLFFFFCFVFLSYSLSLLRAGSFRKSDKKYFAKIDISL